MKVLLPITAGSLAGVVFLFLAPTELPGARPAAPPLPFPVSSERIEPGATPLPAGGGDAADPFAAAALETAREIAAAFEAPSEAPSGRARAENAWERMAPPIDRRFAALDDGERRANVAFVHCLARAQVEPGELSDAELARCFDEHQELLEQRDRDLRAIQFRDVGGGVLEPVDSEEADDQSWAVMLRYRELESELAATYGGSDAPVGSSVAISAR